MYLRVAPIAMMVGGVLLGTSGRLVPAFVAYVLMVWLTMGTVYTILLRRSPDLVRERFRPPSDRDRTTRRIAIPMMIGHYALAGLDARYGWSPVPPALVGVGFVLVFGGLVMAGWSLWENAWASTAVRVQSERNHTVVSTGPYAIVRHPMYLGVLAFALGDGLALGSWVSSLLILPLIAVFVRRTLLEDRMLHAELDGYAAYAARVRWRVIPGVF